MYACSDVCETNRVFRLHSLDCLTFDTFVRKAEWEECHQVTNLVSASLLKELKHANIVVLHDIIHTKRMLTLVFEYVVSFLIVPNFTK